MPVFISVSMPLNNVWISLNMPETEPKTTVQTK